MRLQKFLATAGVDSRRNCEAYIRDGRVTVDGDVVQDPGFQVDSDAQDIRLDGERLRLPSFKYFLLNKPKGVLCTNRDPRGRTRAVDLVPARGQRLFTVGRLDENTEGLLLITNDGDLAEHLAHPRYEVLRRYRVQVAGLPTPETLSELKKGMHFSEGFFRFRGIKVLKRRGRSTFLELELREGKNREIRRLMARVGHKVISLERVEFGPLKLGHLSPGQCRELRPAEVRSLLDFAAELSVERSRRYSKPSPKADAESAGSGSGPKYKAAGGQPAGKKPTGKKPAGRKPSGRKPAAAKTGSRRPVTEGRSEGNTGRGHSRRKPAVKRSSPRKK